ncbi:MAG TPA: sulfate adenylyltransferase, partial [Pyrinomonadaceae bacterium]|nr:sulfate adenylyltransferase [Pyrinomonadaceae bacterium]
MKLISPHGGTLINREIQGGEREELIKTAETLPRVQLNSRQMSDLLMIAIGGYSPLDGFLNEADYTSVRDQMRLANGLVWSIPITLAVTKDLADALNTPANVALYDGDHLLGVLSVTEKFTYDKEREAQAVYGTKDRAHPGVAALFSQGDWLLAGPIRLLNRPRHRPFQEYHLDPSETRTLFRERGWRRVVAFQTRNPVHRAHEYIQKCALEIADGLLLHPIVGDTKSDDVPAHVRIRSYEEILANYYPASRTVLSVMPAAMRYAGPREAVFHALIRKNYGCSLFIVGRDHAGVGNYYGTYDAHYIFDQFDPSELGITPL